MTFQRPRYRHRIVSGSKQPLEIAADILTSKRQMIMAMKHIFFVQSSLVQFSSVFGWYLSSFFQQANKNKQKHCAVSERCPLAPPGTSAPMSRSVREPTNP